jgi:hypothetical protein
MDSGWFPRPVTPDNSCTPSVQRVCVIDQAIRNAASRGCRFWCRGRYATRYLKNILSLRQGVDQSEAWPPDENSAPSDLIPRGRLLSLASAPTGLVATGQKLLASHCQAAGSGGYRSLTTWLVEIEIQLCTVLCGCWTYGVLSLDIRGWVSRERKRPELRVLFQRTPAQTQ